MPVRFGVGKLQTLKETRKEQVTEKKSAEEFDAEIEDVGEEGFSVRIQRKVFTAEAVEGREGKTLSFDEESEVEEFSAGFVERHYLEMLPSTWELLEELMPVDTGAVPVERVQAPPVIADTVPETVPVDTSVEPVLDTHETLPETESMPADFRELPYESFKPERDTAVYEPGIPEEEREVRAEVYIPEEEWGGEETVETADYPAQVQEVEYRVSGVETRQRNAAEVVEEMFEYTGLEGGVELADEIGLTEDFDGDLPEELYEVDIEGMDMDRTEYFINGELAGDAINLYELGPGDSITFVESDVFYSEENEAAYCGTEDALHISDLRTDEIDAIEGYSVPEIPSLGYVSEAYTAPAA